MQATLIYTMSSHCYEGSLFLEQNELDGLSCLVPFSISLLMTVLKLEADIVQPVELKSL